MIVPDGLSLEELIGALKTEIASDEMVGLAGYLNVLETVKRELDKKQDKQQDQSKPDGYYKHCLNGTHPPEARQK